MKNFNDIELAVKRINLDSIIFTLTKREDWTMWNIEKAKKVEQLYRYFLTLVVAYPNKHIVPTKDIDTFWHTHILDTEKYMKDCQEAFGYYIHHFPYFGLRGKKDEKLATDSFLETSILFQKHFNISLIDNIARCSSHCRSACGPNSIINSNATRPSI